MKKKISFQKILNILTDFEEEIANLHFSSVTHKALNFIQDRLGVRRTSIALLNRESGGFFVYDAVMDIQGIGSGSFIAFDKTILSKIVKQKEPLYRPDIKKWKPEYEVDRILLKAGIRANFSIPLMAGGRGIGTLNAGAMRVDGIGENKRIILQMLAPRLAQSIQTSMHIEALTESKELVQSTISSMDDLVFVLDKDLRFLQFYQPAKTGDLYLPPEKFIGRQIGNVGMPSEVVNCFYAAIESLKTSGSVQKMEYSLPFPDGTRWYSAGVSRRMDGKGNITGYTAVARDITKQKRDENALRESEEKFRSLIECSWDAITLFDVNGKILYGSPSTMRILGYELNEFVGKDAFELIHPDDHEFVKSRLAESLRKPQSGVEAYGRVRHKDGDWRFMEGIFTNLLDYPVVRAIVNNYRDVTERKLAEEALIESEERWRSLVENAPDIIFTVDREGKIIFINHPPEGLTVENAIGTDAMDYVYPEHRETARGSIRNVFETGNNGYYEIAARGPRDTCSWYSTHLGPVKRNDEVVAVMLITRDITARKQIEDALSESEERYKKLIASVTDYIFTVEVKDGQPVSTKHGPGCLAVTGYSPEEFDADPYLWYRMVYEDDRERIQEHAERVLSGEDPATMEHRIVHKNGNVIWVRNTPVPRYDYEGRLIAYDGLIEDITERKKAEETLFETKERLRTIFNNTAIGIALTTPRGMFVEANPSFIVMFGYPEEELCGLTISDITHPDDRAITGRYIEELLAGQRHYYQFEKRYVRKSGRTFWGRITASLIKDRFGSPQYIIGVVEDISARKSAEEERQKLHEQFVHAQKMEAVGLLAGGVAHDFNNILTAIIGYANILKMKMKKHDPLKINLDHIINSSLRGAHLTQTLLAFSRKQPISTRPVDLNVIIRNVQKLLSRMISEDIEMLVVLDERPLTILADSGQIEQILMNLATNARDAMPHGGVLTIKTETATIDEQFKKEHGFGEPGRYALLAITDSGIGMDEKTKDRLFEPFFTTKEVGRGTGLGLAMVYGAIKQNKGYIIVSSEPGKGATFNLFLPLFTSDARGEKEESLSVPIKRGTETILLAEDDESLRMLMRSILNEFGYTVKEAKDGIEALEQFTAHKKEVSLIILDVIMPRKNGREVYEEINKIAPQVKALFISGYTADIVHTKAILDQGLHFLSKPILPEQLLKEVRDILDEKSI